MLKTRHLTCLLLLTLGLATANAALAASKQPPPPPPCIAANSGAQLELNKQLKALRTTDSLYRQIIQLHGEPTKCTGHVGQDDTEGKSHLVLSWADGATYERTYMLPETFIVRYSNLAGLGHAGLLLDALRDEASRIGLRIDWHTPHENQEGAHRVVEYRDPDDGSNGLTRLSYNQSRQLVAISLSLAL